MSHLESDRRFAGNTPELYERLMVPLIFSPYADDLARRAAALAPARVLELAAGTGVATRALAAALPPTTEIVATDLSRTMLDEATRIGASRPIERRQADAQSLPFDDASFDLIVCQFGAMFFPDRPGAFAEAHRVLGEGGTLLLALWDRIEENEIADVVAATIRSLYPDDPPDFMRRTPHGYHDRDLIARDLAAGGFTAPPSIETIAHRSRAESARIAAVAFCQGTPLRNEIKGRGTVGIDDATDAVARALEARFGSDAIDAKMQALVVTVRR